jgi:uncharacterized Rmd1/YagE family protein
LTDFLSRKTAVLRTSPQRIDECLYTPFKPPILPSQLMSPASSGRYNSKASRKRNTGVDDTSKVLSPDMFTIPGFETGLGHGSINSAAGESTIVDMERGTSSKQDESYLGAIEEHVRSPYDHVPEDVRAETEEDERDDVQKYRLKSHSFPTKGATSCPETVCVLVYESFPVSDGTAFFLEPQSGLRNRKQSTEVPVKIELGEIYFFDYGVVVMWGLSEAQELHMLSLLAPFEDEKLDQGQVETEEFYYQYRAYSQPRIFNDVITLRYMVWLILT